MKINSNNNAMMQTLKLAAKNSPTLTTESGLENKTQSLEAKKITNKELPQTAAHNLDTRPTNDNSELDTSQIRLLRYKNFHESADTQKSRLQEANTMRPKLFELQNSMKPLYAEFKQQVATLFPDLADKEYGITVDEKGELLIVNNKDDLNEPQQEILNGLLNRFNGASALKSLANEHVQATVDWVELNRRPDGTGFRVGRFDVSKENYQSIIDLVPMLTDDLSSMAHQVSNQIFNKAELSSNNHQVDEYINGEWVSITV